MSTRKQRITKAQADAFIDWYTNWNGRDEDHTIKFIIDQYRALTGIEVSRMFVSNVRKKLNTQHLEEQHDNSEDDTDTVQQ